MSTTTDRRRLYRAADVIRLGALGHLAHSRLDVAAYGSAVSQLDVPERSGFVIVFALNDRSISVIRVRDLPQLGRSPGRYVVFDPDPLLTGFRRRHFETASATPRRRRFSPQCKLAVLREYEAAIEPGAKTDLLRREGLHSSHLVLWRRARETGALRSERKRG